MTYHLSAGGFLIFSDLFECFVFFYASALLLLNLLPEFKSLVQMSIFILICEVIFFVDYFTCFANYFHFVLFIKMLHIKVLTKHALGINIKVVEYRPEK